MKSKMLLEIDFTWEDIPEDYIYNDRVIFPPAKDEFIYRKFIIELIRKCKLKIQGVVVNVGTLIKEKEAFEEICRYCKYNKITLMINVMDLDLKTVIEDVLEIPGIFNYILLSRASKVYDYESYERISGKFEKENIIICGSSIAGQLEERGYDVFTKAHFNKCKSESEFPGSFITNLIADEISSIVGY